MFKDNLIHLRKVQNLTQEGLALISEEKFLAMAEMIRKAAGKN